MALLYRSIVQSEPFRFLVGNEKSEFFLHPSLASYHSPPLDALIHGNMQEAQEGCATIEDVDADTFARFCEYVYTGEYTAAEHAVLLHSVEVEHEEVELDKEQGAIDSGHIVEADLVEDVPLYGQSLRKEIRRGKKKDTFFHKTEPYYDPFEAPQQAPAANQTPDPRLVFSKRSWPREPTRPSSECRPNKSPCEDYTDVFLSHARLYVFADKYDIPSLRSLVLHNLHKTLAAFTLHTESVTDIAMLFRYVYQNTPEREGCMDQLRALVIEYVACHVEKLVSDDIFEEVLRGESSAGSDLTKMMLKRLR